jgi:hypothetical protein
VIDFNLVTTRLATGGAIYTPDDVGAILDAGINAVIDCRAEFDDQALLVRTGALYFFNGMPDDGLCKPKEWFQKSIEFALSVLSRPGIKLLAHCAAGINRGPSTAAAIMMALGWTKEAARAQIVARRPMCAGGLRYIDDAEAAVKALGYT